MPDNRSNNGADSPRTLRQRAEQRLLAGQAEASGMSADALANWCAQLQIAQIELQIQNEELLAAQLAAAEAREHYRELFDYAPVGYLTLDGRETIREANHTAAAMLAAPREELIGKRLPLLVAGEDRELCRRHILQAVSSAGRQSCELTLPGGQGAPLTASLEIAPIETLYPAGGELWVTMTDVTRRKHAEDRLAYLASFPEQNPNPILELDLEGKIRYLNPTAEQLFPDLREQGALHPYLAGSEATIGQLSDGGHHTRIREAMVGDRTYFQAFSYVPERNFVRIYGMDITHHAEVEERLRLLSEITANLLGSDSPEELVDSLCRRVMEKLDCCVFFNFLFDEASDRLRLNASAGVPDELAAEIERRGVATVCGCVAAEGRSIVVADVQRSADPQAELLRALGLQAYACHPLLSGDRAIGALAFGSRWKTAFGEDELSLMRAVAGHVALALERVRLMKSLERHAAEAQAASLAKSQFVASMSHELRTPMNAILGMVGLALAAELPPSVRDYVQTAKESAELLLELLNEILDFSRIEAGRFELERTPFSLRGAIEQVVKTLGVQADERGLELVCQLDDNLPEHVVGDPLRLRQVLMNLVGNAVKFTERGEIEVCVRVAKGLGIRDWGLEEDKPAEKGLGIRDWGLEEDKPAGSDPQLLIPNPQSLIPLPPNPQSLIPFPPNPQSLIPLSPSVTLEFTVRDTGIGISAEDQEKIFSPFTQADASTTRRYGGTGLGLAIAQRLVAMMGGRIWLESHAGRGSTFHFTIAAPIGQAPADRGATGGPSAAGDAALAPAAAPPARCACSWLRTRRRTRNWSSISSDGEGIGSRSPPTEKRPSNSSGDSTSTSSLWTCRCRSWTASRRLPRSANWTTRRRPASPSSR